MWGHASQSSMGTIRAWRNTSNHWAWSILWRASSRASTRWKQNSRSWRWPSSKRQVETDREALSIIKWSQILHYRRNSQPKRLFLRKRLSNSKLPHNPRGSLTLRRTSWTRSRRSRGREDAQLRWWWRCRQLRQSPSRTLDIQWKAIWSPKLSKFSREGSVHNQLQWTTCRLTTLCSFNRSKKDRISLLWAVEAL